jgi:hypothetical protein
VLAGRLKLLELRVLQLIEDMVLFISFYPGIRLLYDIFFVFVNEDNLNVKHFVKSQFKLKRGKAVYLRSNYCNPISNPG